MLQEVDHIFITALREANLYEKIWQAGAMLLPVKSVGVMGDERTYEKCVALRAVESTDGMTADWVDLPYKFLQEVSSANILGLDENDPTAADDVITTELHLPEEILFFLII